MFHVKLYRQLSDAPVVADSGSNGSFVRAVCGLITTWLSAAADPRRIPNGLLFLAGVVLSGMMAPSAHAAVHKCIGADGKVTFSDQPCAVGQAAAAVKPAATGQTTPPKAAISPPVTNGATGATPGRTAGSTAESTTGITAGGSSEDPQDAASRARIRAALPPHCVVLGERIGKYFENGAVGATEAEYQVIFRRYQQECAAQARAASAAEDATRVARQKKQVAEQECATKRQVLAERRPRLANLSSEDKKAFAAVDADVAATCR